MDLNLFTKGNVERKGQMYHVALLDDSEYVGDIASGRRHGVGYMAWSDGLQYFGEWVDNAATGEGMLLWPDGAEYYGQVCRGKRHGRGLYIDASGHYAGEWRAGLRHGLGTQVSTDAVYCGEWVNGARSGWGNLNFNTGNHYEGIWVADVMHGYGSMTWVTNASLSPANGGSPSNVSLNGTATLHSTTGTMINEDTTLDMARTFTANIGALAPGPLGPFNPSVASTEAVFEKYVGQWQDGKPHGNGEYALFFHDGSARDNPFQTINHFVGQFSNGLRHGVGTQLYADGRVFEGEWVDNIKTGHGTLTKPDGSKSSVLVKDDVITVVGSGSTNLAASGRGKPTNTVIKDSSLSTEDALQIADIASEKEITEIKGLVTNYKAILRYLYTAYATIQPHTGYYNAIEQLLNAEDEVPNPASLLQHPVVATVPPLQGISRDKRNKRLCQRACESIHLETVRTANEMAARYAAAWEEMGEGFAFGKGLASLGRQQSMADEAFSVTYAAAPISSEIVNSTFRSFIDVSMPAMAPGSDRKALQNTMCRFQFLQFLDDARVLDLSLPMAKVNTLIAAAVARDPNRTIVPPKPMRAMLRSLDMSADQMSFGVFVESLVRVAEARMAGEGVWFTSCALHSFSLPQRIQLFCDYYIVPLGNALQGMAASGELRVIGIEPFFATSSGNQTLSEMRRAAARTLRERAKATAKLSGHKSPLEGDSVLSTAIGEALDEIPPVGTVATVRQKYIVRVDGTSNDALQVWHLDCYDPNTEVTTSHSIVVHRNDESFSFGGILTQNVMKDNKECLASNATKLIPTFACPVSCDVIARVPSVVQQVERNLLLLVRVFESLQKEERGICRLSDVLNAFLLAGLIKERKKKVVKTVIVSKPKPPPPPPAGKDKGKVSKAAVSSAAAERRPSTPQKAGQGGKMNKKQLQIQQALDAEAALKRQEEEAQRQRLAVLKEADTLPEPEALSILPPSEVPMETILNNLLFTLYHSVLTSCNLLTFPHRVPFDPVVTTSMASDASHITKQFCKVSPMLEEVMHLQRLAAQDLQERYANVRPSPTPLGTSQALLLGDWVPLSFNDFIAVIISLSLTAFQSRTPLQAIRAGFLYLPKLLGVISSRRNILTQVPPLIDSDAPLPVRIKPVPEDPKSKKKGN